MLHSQASVATVHASRYLQQLSKHWSHRFTVTFDPHQSVIEFGDGRSVSLKASDTALDVEARDQDASKLTSLEEVVENHIKRFAFREELAFNWTQHD